MQRERGAFDSFHEPIDLNQGSFPNNASMDNSPSWDNSPVQNRTSNYIIAHSDGNASCTSAANSCTQSFSGWDRGESSSSTHNMQNRAHTDDSRTTVGWPSCSAPDASTENWPNMNNTSFINNEVADRPLNYQNYPSNNDCHRRPTAAEQIPTFYTSSNNVGTFSGSSNTLLENNEALNLNPSFGTWGSSCKRKALEGTSGQFYPGGSSSSNHSMGKNTNQDPHPNSYAHPGNLSISSGPLNLSPINHPDLSLNPNSGFGTSRPAPRLFPSSINPSMAESSARNFSVRSNLAQFDTSRGTSVRSFGVYASPQQLRAPSNTDSSEMRTQLTFNPPPIMNVNEARRTHSSPWSGNLGSRGGSSTNSFMVPGERVSEASVRSSRRNNSRNNLEYPTTISAPETRDVLEDQIDWSFAPGPSRNRSSSHRAGPGSGGQASWLPYQSQSHQRVSDGAPWIPFPRVESDSGIRRGHFSLFPPALDEGASTSGTHNQLDQRPVSFLMDMAGDGVNSRRALASVESRHRMIRQVLNAMRRGVHLQAEDYMLIDPFINGFAELHDRHRDMRLDVDNMSYEELLALEERIGDVSTGLTEDKIIGSMKQRKYTTIGVSPNMEPCCICQEDYIIGDDIGILNCGHEFHSGCIKQWLSVKNICPICKMMALGSGK